MAVVAAAGWRGSGICLQHRRARRRAITRSSSSSSRDWFHGSDRRRQHLRQDNDIAVYDNDNDIVIVCLSIVCLSVRARVLVNAKRHTSGAGVDRGSVTRSHLPSASSLHFRAGRDMEGVHVNLACQVIRIRRGVMSSSNIECVQARQ